MENKSVKSKLASDWLLQTNIFQRVPENKQTLETWSSIIKDQTIYCFAHAAKNADPGIKHDRSLEVTGAHPQVNRGFWFTLAVEVSTTNDKTSRAVHGNSEIEYLYYGMEYVKCSTWSKYFFFLLRKILSKINHFLFYLVHYFVIKIISKEKYKAKLNSKIPTFANFHYSAIFIHRPIIVFFPQLRKKTNEEKYIVYQINWRQLTNFLFIGYKN